MGWAVPVDFVVASTDALTSALSAAQGGDRILLSAGSYAAIGLQGVRLVGEVTITSADPANRAQVAGIELSNCSGLRFENLAVSVTSGSDHVALQDLEIHDPAVRAHSGVLIRDSSDVSVGGSELHDVGA